jgi:hypothetical protein
MVMLLIVAMAAPVVVAQVAQATVPQGVADVAGTAAVQGETAEWGSAVIWAFLSSTLLEWMKRNRRIVFVSDRLAFGAQRLIGIGLAVGTAAGVHASFDAAAGALTITGLLWPNIQTAAGESLRQWVMQEMSYRVAVKNYRQEES